MIKHKLFLICGITLSLVYKLYKMSAPFVLGENNYHLNQIYYSIYRLVIGISIFAYIYYKEKISFKFKKFFNIMAFSYLILTFLIKYYFYSGFKFHSSIFIFESSTNFCVGLFEEAIFRLLIFKSLREILDIKKAVIISSLIFSLWHFDVYGFDLVSYIGAFTFGIFMAIFYEYSQNILYSVIIHAMFDILWSGLYWNLEYNPRETLSLAALEIIFAIGLVKLSPKANSHHKNPIPD